MEADNLKTKVFNGNAQVEISKHLIQTNSSTIPAEICFIIVGFLIVLLNMMEIKLVYEAIKKKLCNSYIYLLNLAISDVFFGIAISLYFIVGIFMQKFGDVNHVIAYDPYQKILILIFHRVTLILSIMNIIALTIDRLFCVIKPFIFRIMRKKYLVCACVGIWMLTIGL